MDKPFVLLLWGFHASLGLVPIPSFLLLFPFRPVCAVAAFPVTGNIDCRISKNRRVKMGKFGWRAAQMPETG